MTNFFSIQRPLKKGISLNREQQLKQKLNRITENIEAAKARVGRTDAVTLLCVTKQSPVDDMHILYDLGVRDFGENRAQVLAEKAEQMPKDARIHMIGSMQTNKLRFVLPHIHLLQSLDRPSLADAIEKRADAPVRCLLEVNIADEDAKQGMAEEEVFSFVDAIQNKDNILLCGLMVMASHTDDTAQIRKDFQRAKALFDQLQQKLGDDVFTILSMGMSYDYEIAVEEGATMVRVGSALMGEE